MSSRPKKYKFRSKFERTFADNLFKRNVRFKYEERILKYFKHPPGGYCLDCDSKNVVQNGRYHPDFDLIDHGFLVETKGKFTPADRKKMLSVIECNPEIDVRMVFMRDNFLTSRKASRYSEWCDLHNIQWAIGSVPEKWLK